jgi:hypothetical protein
VLLVGLAAAPAPGETPPRPGPDRSDFRVEWYRPDGAPAGQGWEIEVTPFRSGSGRYRIDGQADPDDACWALEVPTRDPALVRVRERIGAYVSPWSSYSAVPEPSLGLGLGTSPLLLAALAARRGAATRRAADTRRRDRRSAERSRR